MEWFSEAQLGARLMDQGKEKGTTDCLIFQKAPLRMCGRTKSPLQSWFSRLALHKAWPPPKFYCLEMTKVLVEIPRKHKWLLLMTFSSKVVQTLLLKYLAYFPVFIACRTKFT